MVGGVCTLRNTVAGALAMSAESVRAFLASAAPDLEIVELPASSQTHTLSAAWGIRPAQIAKTLALSVGGRAVLALVGSSDAVRFLFGDQHEHLGQSIAYARFNGVVPPWSK